MALVESLLTAIVRADGDALVMHVGEKPYVVASAGPIELSTHGLNLQAMAGMVAQLLPAEMQRALIECGAVEHELPPLPALHSDRFTVVVARGGDDVWIEIRRHRRSRPAAVTAAAPAAAASVVEAASFVEEAGPVEAPAPLEAARPVEAANVDAPAEPVDEVAPPLPAPPVEPTVAAEQALPVVPPEPQVVLESEAVPEPAAASVIPTTRTLRIEVPQAVPSRRPAGQSEIERLLAIAAARGATALYLTTQASPFLRVDDDVRMLEGEPPLTSTDVESAVLQLMPEATREALRRGGPTEWESELEDIGRIRCSTFSDYRGLGAIFQLVSVRPQSAEQLGLSPEIQALASETEGLVLVASPRGHGKTTLIGALVDLINRQRPGYVITLERQIRFVHEHRRALVSQREVRGTADQELTAARGALREQPDVVVIDDLLSADVFQLALDAAGSGRLVFASVTAPSATAALTRIVELFPADRRKGIQSLLAERMRGAVAQVLLRRVGGGRAAAREVVLATSAVARVLAEGQMQDLPLAIESGRKHGLISLTDSLVQFVRSGAIDAREAYRKADDRDALLLALERENVDMSVVERLA